MMEHKEIIIEAPLHAPVKFPCEKVLKHCLEQIDLLAKRDADRKESERRKEKEFATNDVNPKSPTTTTYRRIPQIIHQTYKCLEKLRTEKPGWKGSPWSWIEALPHWRYQFWSDADCRKLIADNFEWFLPLYDSYTTAIQRVDAFRLFLLYSIGGVYVDLDFKAKKDFTLENLFKEVATLCKIGAPRHFILEDPFGFCMDERQFLGTYKDEEQTPKLTNCFIASEPRSAFVLLCIRVLCSRAIVAQSFLASQKWWCLNRELRVCHSTGPGCWTEALRLYVEQIRKLVLGGKVMHREEERKGGEIEEEGNQEEGEKELQPDTSDAESGNLLSFVDVFGLTKFWNAMRRTFQREFKTTHCEVSDALLRFIKIDEADFSLKMTEREGKEKKQHRSEEGIVGRLPRKSQFKPPYCSVAVIPSEYFFPMFCYFFAKKPCSLPTTVTIQLDGWSWLPNKYSQRLTEFIIQFLFYLQILRSREVSSQVRRELMAFESSYIKDLESGIWNESTAAITTESDLRRRKREFLKKLLEWKGIHQNTPTPTQPHSITAVAKKRSHGITTLSSLATQQRQQSQQNTKEWQPFWEEVREMCTNMMHLDYLVDKNQRKHKQLQRKLKQQRRQQQQQQEQDNVSASGDKNPSTTEDAETQQTLMILVWILAIANFFLLVLLIMVIVWLNVQRSKPPVPTSSLNQKSS